MNLLAQFLLCSLPVPRGVAHLDCLNLRSQILGNIPDEETRQFEDMITWQDVPIVESQRTELLPLDLQAELHLRSDRTPIACRTQFVPRTPLALFSIGLKAYW